MQDHEKDLDQQQEEKTTTATGGKKEEYQDQLQLDNCSTARQIKIYGHILDFACPTCGASFEDTNKVAIHLGVIAHPQDQKYKKECTEPERPHYPRSAAR